MSTTRAPLSLPASVPNSGASLSAVLRDLRWSEMAIPLAVLAIVMAMITPLPPILLDVLISANVTISLIVLLVSMYIIRPVEFSVFPTALLLLTLFRLALNISSSRLILLNGGSGTSAAGEVIEAFGNFVVGGNTIVGVVIFLVLIAIQYVVINHGAVRISEVTARFTLDAMPGKQMSIDSDLNAGLIDESEARARRKALSAEAEFYGAMDGASRFTQRDAVASILITGINIIAGFLIGVLQHDLDLMRALKTYTVLTIGDGLVTVIPALMVSISGGLVVTRASSEAQMGSELKRQIFSNSEPLLLASGVLVALALFPGLPTVPFLLLGGGVGYAGYRLRVQNLADRTQAALPSPPPRENVEALLRVDLLAVEVGLGLVRLVEGGVNSPLLKRIAGIRKQIATEIGYVLPPVRVTDNVNLKSREYVISLKGVELARYELAPGCELAIPPSGGGSIEGVATREPAFGIAALWISSDQADRARGAGYTVVDAISVLGTHLSEIVRSHAYEMFSRQDTKRLLDRINEENPKLIEDLVPKLLSMGTVQKVLQNLLKERVSIRDAGSILEALSEAAPVTRNPILMTEYVRQSIRRMVAKPYVTKAGALNAFLTDASIDGTIEGAIEHTDSMSHLNLGSQKIREILDKVQKTVGSPETPAVLVTSSGTRYFLRQIVEGSIRNLVVLSHNEIPAGVKVVSLGVVQ